MTPPTELEPAARDPRKLQRTAWILVAVMLLGGWLILRAYGTWSSKQSADDRPAIVHRIRKERDLRLMRQDGEVVDLFSLRGTVLAMNVWSLRDPETARRSMAVMKRLAEARAGDGEFHLVTLVVDSIPAASLRDTLARTAETQGLKLPQWWLGGTEPGTLHKFIKNELKAAVFPNEAAGKWQFDPTIILIDRNGHIRRAVVPKTRNGKPAKPEVVAFDFDMAAAWDREGMKSGTEHSNETEMEILLNQTIDRLLAETTETR